MEGTNTITLNLKDSEGNDKGFHDLSLEFRRELFRHAQEVCDGNISKIARHLKMDRRTVQRMMNKTGQRQGA